MLIDEYTPIAVVLLSGGMDSCVTLAQAVKDGCSISALHVNYGQRTQDRELQAFQDICDHYQIHRRLVVDISHLAQIGGSALTDLSIDVPHNLTNTTRESNVDDSATTIPVTYVPFRNANILSIATSWAEVLGAHAIYIGAVEEDSSGYPDCRESFFSAFQQVIAQGTRPETQIEIRTPLIHLTKAQIVGLGGNLLAPLHLSWSCYEQQDKACGRCDSCQLRLKGFSQAGVKDPIQYQ